MARWTVTPGTVGNTMTARGEYDHGIDGVHYEVKQDVTDILKEVERDRDLLAHGRRADGWRKAFTIPDVVAIEILSNHGLDVHDPMFMHDRDKMNRLKYIMRTEYKHLLIAT